MRPIKLALFYLSMPMICSLPAAASALTPADRAIPRELATDYQTPSSEALAGAPRRAIALVERELDDTPNMLTMRELEIAPDDHTGPLVTVTEGQQTTRYRVVASHFEDATTFFPMLGQWEIWQLINLTEDTHPIHVHLDAFQVLDRHPATVQVPSGGITTTGTGATVRIGQAPDDGIPHALDANELGLKDTVRVNANEVVDIVVRFLTHCGRYMYHCHILEHEDYDMMRPFVIMPPELMPFM